MDNLSRERRSENMRRIRSSGTKPEIIVRKLVTGLGYRYRLNRRDLPGKPDLVFAGRKKVIFVHGCFWHQHSNSDCRIVRVPKSALDYWRPKLERNAMRDADAEWQLRKAGWGVLVLWECEVNDAASLGRKLCEFLQ